MQVPFLGKIPLDPRLARACDEGKSFLEEYPNSETANCFREVIKNALSNLPQKDAQLKD